MYILEPDLKMLYYANKQLIILKYPVFIKSMGQQYINCATTPAHTDRESQIFPVSLSIYFICLHSGGSDLRKPGKQWGTAKTNHPTQLNPASPFSFTALSPSSLHKHSRLRGCPTLDRWEAHGVCLRAQKNWEIQERVYMQCNSLSDVKSVLTCNWLVIRFFRWHISSLESYIPFIWWKKNSKRKRNSDLTT